MNSEKQTVDPLSKRSPILGWRFFCDENQQKLQRAHLLSCCTSLGSTAIHAKIKMLPHGLGEFMLNPQFMIIFMWKMIFPIHWNHWNWRVPIIIFKHQTQKSCHWLMPSVYPHYIPRAGYGLMSWRPKFYLPSAPDSLSGPVPLFSFGLSCGEGYESEPNVQLVGKKSSKFHIVPLSVDGHFGYPIRSPRARVPASLLRLASRSAWE